MNGRHLAAALMFCAAMAAVQPLAAQSKPGGGRGMGDPGLGVGLLLMQQVQDDLQLSDQQKAQLLMLGMQTQGGNRGNMQKQLASVLKPEQMKRLKQIHLQIEGPTALASPELAKSLGLSAEQVSKLKSLQAKNRKKMQEELAGMKGMTQSERHAKMLEFRKAAGTEAIGLLTPPQREMFEQMQGKKIDFKMP